MRKDHACISASAHQHVSVSARKQTVVSERKEKKKERKKRPGSESAIIKATIGQAAQIETFYIDNTDI